MCLSETDSHPQGSTQAELLVMGVGNPDRGDDGLGPWVVAELSRRTPSRKRVRLLCSRQLTPEMAEHWGAAERVILVDAAACPLERGWCVSRIKPDLNSISYLTHDVEPSYLLGLVGLLYGREPRAWIFAIQGEDFSAGRSLSRPARIRAQKAVRRLARAVCEKE